jgi:hypothetical protein
MFNLMPGALFIILVIVNFSFMAGVSAPVGKEPRVIVEPKETDTLLANPGMGWQTFHTFADEDRNLAGLPSSCAYFRFYWREIEPADGRIDFAKLDGLLARAQKAGQKFAFRVMCTGSGEYMDVPQWLRDQGCKGHAFEYEGRKHWVPDFEDPLFQKAHFRLIRELGKRYDGSPALDLVDIGSVGLWGEWHMSGTKEEGTGEPVPLPAPQTRMAIIDAWRAAFPKTPKVMLIGDEEGVRRATRSGCGWRADCLGDMGGFSKTWNHMQHFYMQQLEKTGAGEAWKTGPVAFESCWDMRKWKQEGWDIRFIFDYALRLHASYLNNKSAPIPEGSREEIERFLRKLGYRLVLRRWEHAATAAPGSSLPVSMVWENVGVAPPYRDYRIGVRLDSLNGRNQREYLFTGDSVKGWLPGRHEAAQTVSLPRDLPPGRYELSVALLGPDGKPAIRLAIDSLRTEDGWYRMSRIEIRASR